MDIKEIILTIIMIIVLIYSFSLIINSIHNEIEECNQQNNTGFVFIDKLDGEVGYWVNCSIYKNVTTAI